MTGIVMITRSDIEHASRQELKKAERAALSYYGNHIKQDQPHHQRFRGMSAQDDNIFRH
jgi:hypothetical protein